MMWESLTKNGAKNKKIKIDPRVPLLALGEEVLPRVPEQWLSGKRLLPRVSTRGTRGRGHLPRVLEHVFTRGRHFSIFWQTTPSNVAVKCKFPFASAPLPRVLH
jgi:hypothetical protein